MRLFLAVLAAGALLSAAERVTPFQWHITSQTGSTERVHVDVIRHHGGVTICAISRQNPQQCSNQNSDSSDARVNYTVHVPRGVGLIGRTVNGTVAPQGLEEDVSAETVNGEIHISTNGNAQAKTVNGNITASCSMKSAALTTINGSISLQTQSLTDSALRAETKNGVITTDFQMARHRSPSSRHIDAKYGNGSREIILKTVNGSIEVRRPV